MEPEKIKAIDDVAITDEEINAWMDEWMDEWYEKLKEYIMKHGESIAGEGVPKQ